MRWWKIILGMFDGPQPPEALVRAVNLGNKEIPRTGRIQENFPEYCRFPGRPQRRKSRFGLANLSFSIHSWHPVSPERKLLMC
jgi:hypothetical protein